MSMSLDGFITGPDDGMEHPLGRGGYRLHDWLKQGGSDPGAHRPVRPEDIELELVRVLEAPGVTHLRYRVRYARRAQRARSRA